MTITNEMINELKKVIGATRNDVIEKVSKIVVKNVADNFRLAKSSKVIRIDENHRIELTTKKTVNGIIVKSIDIVTEKPFDYTTIKIQ